MSTDPDRWMAVHLPALPLEMLDASHPSKDSATAQVILDDGRVSMRNEQARLLNIELGSTLATAHSIYPDLVYAHRDPDGEHKRLLELANILYRCSSHVCLQSPDVLLLEVGGSIRLFGHEQLIADIATELCVSMGHRACTRLAQTPAAAVALARSGQTDLTQVPLTQASLEIAGVPESAIERFANMGIYTLGQVLGLPDKALGKRFGATLLLYLGRIRGQIADPREPISPAPFFERQIHLLEPLRNKSDLLGTHERPLNRLTMELQQWLITHQLGCEKLQWTFSSFNPERPGDIARLPVHFARAKQNQSDFLRVSELKLEQSELPDEILSIQLTAKRLKAWDNVSQSLFLKHLGSKGHETDHDPTTLVDEFIARMGRDACRGINNVERHVPERAYTDVSSAVTARKEITPPLCTSHRPLWLFNQPRRARREDLTILRGPERIQAEWWTDDPSGAVCRDYFIAQHTSGIECWAFVDSSQEWYLHGYFG